ncbi:DUF2624 family protein [Fictibacillus sp. Mic-4]|uniref:DUF2624 family protein n=1 Tax=Fictibacillus TaxID=1329200 RepID=UPI000421E97F|nr:DUF2624 family protein [Fictibacillus gelatini]
MNPITLHFLNQKINSLTPQELMNLAAQYNVHITQAEAQKVVAILRRQKIDVKNVTQRKMIVETIAREVSREKANMVQYLIDNYLN